MADQKISEIAFSKSNHAIELGVKILHPALELCLLCTLQGQPFRWLSFGVFALRGFAWLYRLHVESFSKAIFIVAFDQDAAIVFDGFGHPDFFDNGLSKFRTQCGVFAVGLCFLDFDSGLTTNDGDKGCGYRE